MKSQNCRSACLFYLLGITAVSSQMYLGGTLPANTTSLSVNFTFTIPANIAGINFKINNQSYSNVVFFADTDPISNLTITPQSLSDYYLQNHSILQHMDIPRAIGGYGQIVNLNLPIGTNTLYFMIYNLDLPQVLTNKSYLFQIALNNNGTPLCYQCPSSSQNNQSSNTCQCAPCPQSTFGLACENYEKTLAPNNPVNATFYKMNNLYYRILNPSETIVLSFTQLTNTSSSTLYIQYQAVVGGIAGYLNTHYDLNGQSYSYKITNNTKSISIQTKGKNISLTIACRQQINTVINLSYSQTFQDQNNTLGLILGLGIGIPISVIIILVVIVCLFCRQRTNISTANTLLNQFHLTLQEIERYLPEVSSDLALKNLKNLDQSKESLQNQGEIAKKAENGYQCCICLIQITQNQKIRVGYCRHFFHSSCLMVWFAKNQSCPYCRMEFNFSQTFSAYTKLKKNGPELTGQELVEAILNVVKQGSGSSEKKVSEEKNVENEEQSNEAEIQQSQEISVQRNQGILHQRRQQAAITSSPAMITPSRTQLGRG